MRVIFLNRFRLFTALLYGMVLFFPLYIIMTAQLFNKRDAFVFQPHELSTDMEALEKDLVNKNMRIPRVIHQLWLGNKPPPYFW